MSPVVYFGWHFPKLEQILSMLLFFVDPNFSTKTVINITDNNGHMGKYDIALAYLKS